MSCVLKTANSPSIGAYDTRESVIASVEQMLAPDGLRPDDLETVIADSMAGSAQAREAWPLSISQEDISAVLAEIDVPVIAVSGEHDRVDPPAILREELIARLPGAELLVLPGIGHLSPLEAPDDVADILSAFAISRSEDVPETAKVAGESSASRCDWCGITSMEAVKRRISERAAKKPL